MFLLQANIIADDHAFKSSVLFFCWVKGEFSARIFHGADLARTDVKDQGGKNHEGVQKSIAELPGCPWQLVACLGILRPNATWGGGFERRRALALNVHYLADCLQEPSGRV
ncbi:hypothetical protein M569_15203 [Genlisea aurea]|uniref:Uncharacterized protein n=1 Tax=Genlisea aurea TaxID=192259 RepID=S8DJD3_9LAMI|nr:hypothetical protein M569_15203 [Genlisea aurea]